MACGGNVTGTGRPADGARVAASWHGFGATMALRRLPRSPLQLSSIRCWRTPRGGRQRWRSGTPQRPRTALPREPLVWHLPIEASLAIIRSTIATATASPASHGPVDGNENLTGLRVPQKRGAPIRSYGTPEASRLRSRQGEGGQADGFQGSAHLVRGCGRDHRAHHHRLCDRLVWRRACTGTPAVSSTAACRRIRAKVLS